MLLHFLIVFRDIVTVPCWFLSCTNAGLLGEVGSGSGRAPCLLCLWAQSVRPLLALVGLVLPRGGAVIAGTTSWPPNNTFGCHSPWGTPLSPRPCCWGWGQGAYVLSLCLVPLCLMPLVCVGPRCTPSTCPLQQAGGPWSTHLYFGSAGACLVRVRMPYSPAKYICQAVSPPFVLLTLTLCIKRSTNPMEA